MHCSSLLAKPKIQGVGHKSNASKRGRFSGKDRRFEIGEEFQPYARFDRDIERFVCRGCGCKCETVRVIQAHLAECETAKC